MQGSKLTMGLWNPHTRTLHPEKLAILLFFVLNHPKNHFENTFSPLIYSVAQKLCLGTKNFRGAFFPLHSPLPAYALMTTCLNHTTKL
jgi:hypothetical protein